MEKWSVDRMKGNTFATEDRDLKHYCQTKLKGDTIMNPFGLIKVVKNAALAVVADTEEDRNKALKNMAWGVASTVVPGAGIVRAVYGDVDWEEVADTCPFW